MVLTSNFAAHGLRSVHLGIVQMSIHSFEAIAVDIVGQTKWTAVLRKACIWRSRTSGENDIYLLRFYPGGASYVDIHLK